MKRNTPMSRTGFKTPAEMRKAASSAVSEFKDARLFVFMSSREQRLESRAARTMAEARPRTAVVVNSAQAAPVAKAAPVRSDRYRRLVASLPCAICGTPGYSQAAHANTGKGMGMKACDLTCFPACGPRPGIQGCHAALDQGALFTKAARRELEPVWAADTQRRIHAMGLWPKGVPYPHEDQGSNRDH